MIKKITIFLITIFLLMPIKIYCAEQRFPKPEFENGHTQPPTQIPQARSLFLEYTDVFILVLSLAIVSWLVIKKRSRKGVLVMTIFSIAYFGFYKKGCVCSVGSLQNITMALFSPEYAIPLTTILIFLIPLFFTLFFGRTFCAGVCPLGAIQDIVAFKPIELKKWLQSLLGLFPFLYLGLAIVYAATSTDFIICRYDPFVGIYRFNASFLMFSLGGLLLLIGVFIARPYCRFFCPYGVLLNWVSRFSSKHLTISPAECIDCKLCESSCPYGAIQKPTPAKLNENRQVMVKRLIMYSIITPLLMLLCGFTGSLLHQKLAGANATVHLANELINQSQHESLETTLEISTFKGSGKGIEKLYEDAIKINRQFYYGGWVLGIFFGLVLGLSLANLSIYHYRSIYTPNKGTCLSCARCIDYCPVKINTKGVDKNK